MTAVILIALSLFIGLAVHSAYYAPKNLWTSGFGVTRTGLTVSKQWSK